MKYSNNYSINSISMSESVPPTSSEILYQNTSNQVAGNKNLTLDTTYDGSRLNTANVIVSNQSILSGNVGIHTATPRGSLEVTGATILAAKGSDLTGIHQFGLNGSYDSLSLVSPVGLGLNGTTSIFFGLNSLIYYPVARIVAVDNGNYSGSLAFQIGNGEQLYQQMRLTMDGVVTGNAAFLYKTVNIPAPGINLALIFPLPTGNPAPTQPPSIIDVYVILQRTADASFANMVKFTVFLGTQIYVTNINVQAIGSSSIIISRNGVTVSNRNVIVSFTDTSNNYTASINYMIYGPATLYLNSITSALNVSVSNSVPGIPSGVTATPGNESIVLSWSVPPNGGSTITSYTVTYISQSPPALTIIVLTNSATITGLTNGTSYSFTILATNSIGNSGSTNPITATPAIVPTAPLSVIATKGNGSVDITWTIPSSNGGSQITSYTITATIVSSGFIVSTSSVSGTSGTILGLTNGTEYKFTVFAINSIGSSPGSSFSNSVTPSTIPNPPTSIIAVAGNKSVSLSWTAPLDTGGSPITGYQVYDLNNALKYDGTGNTTTSTTISSLSDDTSYTFIIKTLNANGSSVSSGSSNSVTTFSVPDAPTSVSATPGIASALVSWVAPLSTGGSPITGYTITSSPGLFTANSSSVTPTTVTGLTPGDSYTFVVVATNAIGNSSNSTASISVTIFSVPGEPSNLNVVADSSSAILSWLTPNSGGSPILGYKIFNGSNVYNSSTNTFVTDSPSIYSSPTGSTNATLLLTPGTSYTLTIKAINIVGSSTAATFSAFTPGLPGPPNSLTAAGANQSAVLNWVAPTSTGGSAITGYKVYDSNDILKYDGTGNSSITARITGLTNGVTYTFFVVALNANGPSSYSGGAIVTPQITSPAYAQYMISSTSGVSTEWFGDELLFYSPYGYGNGSAGPYINITMPSDYLTNAVYYGRRIYTALITPSPLTTTLRFIVGANVVNLNFSGPTVAVKWTAWALGPAFTNVGAYANPYGIFVEGYEMGDVSRLMPT